MRHPGVWVGLVAALLPPWHGAPAFAQDASSRQARPAAASAADAIRQGRTLVAAGDFHRARAVAEGMLARDPTSAEGHYLLGLVLEAQKDWRAAEAQFAA